MYYETIGILCDGCIRKFASATDDGESSAEPGLPSASQDALKASNPLQEHQNQLAVPTNNTSLLQSNPPIPPDLRFNERARHSGVDNLFLPTATVGPTDCMERIIPQVPWNRQLDANFNAALPVNKNETELPVAEEQTENTPAHGANFQFNLE